MRSIYNYDNIIVFSGFTGEFKMDLTISPVESTYERDLTGSATSSAVGIDPLRLITDKDIIWHMDKWGTIIDPEYDGDTVKFNIIFSSDMYQRKIFNMSSVNLLDNFNVTNEQFILVGAIGEYKYLLSSGDTSYADVIFRQLILKHQLLEINDFENKAVVLMEDEREPLHIRLDDPEISIIKEDYSEDSVNELILIDEDNPAKYQHYFFDPIDGVSKDRSILKRVAVNDVMSVKSTEWNDIAIAKDYFKKQEYSMEVEIAIPYPTGSFDLDIYGRDIVLHRLNEDIQNTKVTKVKIADASLTITFGTTRSRLDDLMKGD